MELVDGEVQQCDNSVVGDNYTTQFLQHPQIDTTVARAMDRDRVLAVNAKSLEEYFERLSESPHVTTPTDPDDIWNLDEQGFMMGRSGTKNELVSSRVRVKAPRRMQQGSW